MKVLIRIRIMDRFKLCSKNCQRGMCCLNGIEKIVNNILTSSNDINSKRKNQNLESNLNLICDVDTLRTLIKNNKVRVVDVRKKDEYMQEHIPTAVSLP